MQSGDVAIVNYGERALTWRTRLLLSQVSHDCWSICAPDFGLYEEQLPLANPDYTDFRFLGAAGPLPADVLRLRYMDFKDWIPWF